MKRKEILVILLISVMLTLIAGCAGPTVKFGSINVTSTPTGAKVYINGVDTGMVTPIIFTKEVGSYVIKLDKFHYKIWEGSVTVNANQTTYINPPLTWASPKTITLQPGSEGKDSGVSSATPTTNCGNSNDFLVGSCLTLLNIRTYIEFDLSTVPGNARVVGASLKIYKYMEVGSGSNNAGLYQVTSNWKESAITWNNQPTSSTVAESSCIVSSVSTGWITWDNIYDLVQGWLGGTIANYGMLLKTTDETADLVVHCWSSDYKDASKRPKLTITYYIP